MALFLRGESFLFRNASYMSLLFVVCCFSENVFTSEGDMRHCSDKIQGMCPWLEVRRGKTVPSTIR